MKKSLQKLTLATGSAFTSLTTIATIAKAQTIDTIEVNASSGFFGNIGTLINSGLKFIMVIAALLVFMYLIWGGIEWITSGGDKTKTESARSKITAAVIGLIVVAASYAILQLVLTFLNVGDLNSLLQTV